MSEISRVSLFGKLNPLAYKALESATVFCKMRGNPYVELSHYVHQLVQQPDCDFKRIIEHSGLDPARLSRDLTEALDRLPRGSTSISDLSSHLEDSVERAWVYSTLMFQESQVRTGHLLIAWLKTPNLKHVLLALSKEFGQLKLDEITESFHKLTAASPEASMLSSDGSQLAGATPGEASAAMPPAPMGKQEALRRYAVDLTEKARKGELDPIVGRDAEIRQCIDILLRRRQNNPILTGEAGVGKTAAVEGLAQRIASGDVPPQLKDVSLRTLDVGLLSAGASMKGEFENRLRQVIEEVQASPKPIILFIDEAHTLIGAGGAQGTGDAANLLKPALARGTLRTIAATTWAEYKKYIEKDPALTRRFQVVQVDEPSEQNALLMMRGIASTLESHHRVQLLDEALEAAVKLSHRYIPARQLPDKAVSLLDTACARVAVSQHATPAEVEDSRHRIDALQTELDIIAREAAVGVDVSQREMHAKDLMSTELERRQDLEARWHTEKSLVDRILALRAALREMGSAADTEVQEPEPSITDTQEREAVLTRPDRERERLLTELRSLQTELTQLQGERPLILPSVDAQAVASVVGDWTGIPVGRMLQSELETVLKLPEVAGARVIGQRHALEMIGRRIQTSRAGLENPNKPVGVFLLAGPSGVGKTETALTLAETLYGGEQNLITINMSEFQEAHTVSTLKGAPPGYVGYGEGGVLTEAVRRKPYSVVLLDEVEKAHSDVHEIFFQVFDKGAMEDGEGRRIDFKNTLILLTSNVGSDLIMQMCRTGKQDPETIARALRKPLLEVFPAALLGRMVTIPYYPLSEDMLSNIVRLQLGRVQKRLTESHGIPLEFDDKVVQLIVSRCSELESGARVIDALLTNTLLPRISQALLTRTLEGRPLTRAAVTVEKGEFAYTLE
ncbi:MAG TPA: type VI secretion system ATPase TssH [Polyangiales bacterium]|nr:type VI secretion system ATPase TssH [Polyangiales bacterium]